jgi:hypothetical protein
LKGPSALRISRSIKAVLAKLPMPREIRVAVDVDALHLL